MHAKCLTPQMVSTGVLFKMFPEQMKPLPEVSYVAFFFLFVIIYIKIIKYQEGSGTAVSTHTMHLD